MKYKVRKANLNDLEKIVEFIVAEANDAEGISKSPHKILNSDYNIMVLRLQASP